MAVARVPVIDPRRHIPEDTRVARIRLVVERSGRHRTALIIDIVRRPQQRDLLRSVEMVEIKTRRPGILSSSPGAGLTEITLGHIFFDGYIHRLPSRTLTESREFFLV